jgi:ribosomal-protein-alanine N-acetyltransferase
VALLNQEVPQAQDCVAGCIGCWMADNELHVVTLAVIPELRGAGIGLRLMVHELNAGLRCGARRASLEVRRENIPARRLYEGLGFRPTGVRPRYYLDTGEDALVMWLDDLDAPEWHFRMRRANARLGIG